MFKHYLKITTRNLYRQKTFSLINITGLSIGIACCLLIAAYVQDELSYDRHQKNGDRIYRIADYFTVSGKDLQTAMTPAAWGPGMCTEFPEIENMTRIFNSGSGNLVRHEEKKFSENALFYADSTLFSVFQFAFVAGDPAHALDAPHRVVITQAMAEKYFGEGADALNKSLRINGDSTEYTVAGVIENARYKSHFQPDFIASFSTMEREPFYTSWTLHNSLYTYLLLSDHSSPNELELKIPAFLKRHLPPDIAARYTPRLQKLADIHLYSNLLAELSPGGSAIYVYIFSVIALFILIIACINYMNLTTARSIQRAKEVGVRKVLGADRKKLFGQFMIESFALSLLAVLLSVVLTELALPVMNQLAEKNIEINFAGNLQLMAGLFFIWIVVGSVSGIYPGMVLSHFEPIKIMRKQTQKSGMGLLVRRGLVVFQFAISIGLIISTLIISGQMQYMASKKLGFEKDHVIVIPIQSNTMQSNYESIKTELLRNQAVKAVGVSSFVPGQPFSQQMFQPEGLSEKERLLMPVLSVDRDFLNTLGIEIAQGRGFSRDFSTDGESFIINEATVKKLDWDQPLGKQFEWWRPTGNSQYQLMKKGPVIGVVKDFNFASLRQSIEPMVIHIRPDDYSYFSVRIGSDDISGTIEYLKTKWQVFDPENIFDYSFLDKNIENQYRTEQRMEKIFSYFAAMGVGIACLGLLGLASFTAQQRTKEIGVRKVLGATVGSIIRLLSREFIILIVCANVIAAPVIYYFMKEWLQNFAYRTDIHVSTFIISGLIALMVALLTVSFQAIKAATANPVEALKYE